MKLASFCKVNDGWQQETEIWQSVQTLVRISWYGKEEESKADLK